ncbi:DUF1835 domain-containing protein [Mangrovivirga sp. M17]|uniref:DUF1835 domain-containing protein n=1 Tax=Mangrovivirga halotolerans TaxID=2993936 RepID=A0ABT3RKL7_9BACT|nr:DUF1835 domain-containing protein [Mangrovivirga halotolerans]MCX2742340.1 DUF1835 domain-containing protein [Mangrovivirga halotolerans]
MNVHIINSYKLLNRLPKEASGKKIVIKEALSQGPVSNDTLPKLFEERAQFFKDAYGISEEVYYGESMPEIMKIPAIKKFSKVNLWFEHDIMSQVNLWFTCSLINFNIIKELSLVLPSVGHQNGFENMNKLQIAKTFKNKINLTYHQFTTLQNLWVAYCEKNFAAMHKLSRPLSSILPLLSEVIRVIESDYNGFTYAKKVLNKIQKDKEKDELKLIEKFKSAAPIYGYEEAQVAYLLEIIQQ